MRTNTVDVAPRTLPHVEVEVLHLDIDDQWAQLTRRWMQRRGWRTHRLRSHSELRDYLNVRPLPRCLVMDVALADSDGLSLCDRIKGSPALQGIPIVIMTGDLRASSADCLAHQAMYRVQKGPTADADLGAALGAIFLQQDRARGVVDAGDLRLDPRGGLVMRDGKTLAALAPGVFEALRRLVQSSPACVLNADLYDVFLARCSYRKRDPELAVRHTVFNYVSRLRRSLGPDIGARIVRLRGEGYAYHPPHALPSL